MSPLSPILLCAVILTGLFFVKLGKRYASWQLSLIEADIMREFQTIKERIWAGEVEDEVTNMIIELHRKYNFHPKIDRYMIVINEEVANYDLYKKIRSQKLIKFGSEASN